MDTGTRLPGFKYWLFHLPATSLFLWLTLKAAEKQPRWHKWDISSGRGRWLPFPSLFVSWRCAQVSRQGALWREPSCWSKGGVLCWSWAFSALETTHITTYGSHSNPGLELILCHQWINLYSSNVRTSFRFLIYKMGIIKHFPCRVTKWNKMDIAYRTHYQAHNKLPINGGGEWIPVFK